jgi:SAM-dependent methyltransferase
MAEEIRADVIELITAGRDREAAQQGAGFDAAVRCQPDRTTGGRHRPSHPGGSPMTDTLSTDGLAGLKGRQQATWASGDYAVIGSTLQLVGESLCEAVDVQAGWTVLDVAAGNGNAALAAARRGCEVLATDYVEALLDRAVLRAEAEGLTLRAQGADAEALPFDDGSFDAVLSTFGVMFTPNPMQAGAELVRVCRPGGRIGLANWTPEGFMFTVVGGHVPPPAGVPSPLQWGTEAGLAERLAGAEVRVTRKHFTFRYRSAEDWFETFRVYYGPTLKAWDALDDAGRTSFREQLVALADGANRAGNGSLAVDSEYLEVVATRRQ